MQSAHQLHYPLCCNAKTNTIYLQIHRCSVHLLFVARCSCRIVDWLWRIVTVSDGAAQNFQLFRVWSLVFIGLSLHPRSPDRAGTGQGWCRQGGRQIFFCLQMTLSHNGCWWRGHCALCAILSSGTLILLFAAAAHCLKCFNWINTHFHVDTATGACGSALWILMWWEGYSV